MKKIILLLLALVILFSGCIFETLYAFGMYNTPKQCTQTDGKLLIKGFDFNSTNILLNIQNASPNPITITSFEGTPIPIVWENTQESLLEKTETKLFILRSSLAGNITEDITINYTSNGSKRMEKTTCLGLV